MLATLRMLAALLYVAGATLLLAPMQWLALRTGWLPRGLFPRVWHRTILRALRMRVHVTGGPGTERPLLIAANHISWTDIMVLGAAAEVVFIAKSEVRDWPIMGLLARLQRTVFVERERRRQSGDQAGEVSRRLAGGEAVVLFAEGTTADGNIVLPFKSTLFGAAAMALRESSLDCVTVQPVAIAYTRIHGLPMGRQRRTTTAWIGEFGLVEHIRLLLAEAPLDVELIFGEPIPFRPGDSRKTLAKKAEESVRSMMAAALRNPRPLR